MAPQNAIREAETFIDTEVFGGLSNTEICGSRSPADHVRGGPSHAPSGPPKIYERPREKMFMPFAGGNVYRLKPLTFTAHVRLHHHLHTSLDPYDHDRASGFRDVYVVTRPDLTARALTRSLRHWSVYCNSHFYHLTAERRPGGQRLLFTSMDRESENRRETGLKHEDLSSRETDAYQARLHDPGPVLLAYHVGQTDCEPQEILKLSEWIIKHLRHYDFFNNNCQHFALCLCARILNRQTNNAVFMGTTRQIVDWDTCGHPAHRPEHEQMRDIATNRHQDGFLTGFCISKPNGGGAPSWLRRYNVHRKEDLQAYQLYVLWEQGTAGSLPNNILEYSAWRRQLAFPLVTNLFPGVRKLLFEKPWECE